VQKDAPSFSLTLKPTEDPVAASVNEQIGSVRAK